jgi:hypothetical protein
MRYKNNVLEKLGHIDVLTSRMAIQINRNIDKEEILESLTQLKESIESTREIIAIEGDDFEQQFSPQ